MRRLLTYGEVVDWLEPFVCELEEQTRLPHACQVIKNSYLLPNIAEDGHTAVHRL